MVSDEELTVLKALIPNRVRSAADCGCAGEVMSSLERRGFVRIALRPLSGPTKYALTAVGRGAAQGRVD